MSDTLLIISNRQVLICASDGKHLKSERDALDLIGEAMRQGCEWVLVPVERLDENFFHLKTCLAGEIIQKFVTYRRHLVLSIIWLDGSISFHVYNNCLANTPLRSVVL